MEQIRIECECHVLCFFFFPLDNTKLEATRYRGVVCLLTEIILLSCICLAPVCTYDVLSDGLRFSN